MRVKTATMIIMEQKQFVCHIVVIVMVLVLEIVYTNYLNLLIFSRYLQKWIIKEYPIVDNLGIYSQESKKSREIYDNFIGLAFFLRK